MTDKVKGLAENNAHLRAALVKAEDECSTWRQRAEEAEECLGDERTVNEHWQLLHAALATENQAMRQIITDWWNDPDNPPPGASLIASLPPVADPEPQPSDGPDYHAEHTAWRRRNFPLAGDCTCGLSRIVHNPSCPLSGFLAPDTEGEGT